MCNYNECCPDNNNSNCPDSGGGTQTIYVNSVSVAPGSVTLNVGEWFYGAYAEICPLNADCRNVRWYSDDPDVASVGETSGYICANSAGTARIYAEATDGSGCSDYITVTVSSRIYVESVSLDYSSISIEEGQNVYITATVCPGNATDTSLNWSSSNTSVARVSGGVVTGVSKGTARITATAADGSGKSASCTVHVTREILVSSITVTADKSTLLEGTSTCCRATVYPSNADNTNVTWSSENGNIATVCENSGIVTAQSAGTTHIYATACDGSGVVVCCQITVTPKIMVSSIEVDPSAKTMKVGDTCCCLSATVYPSTATDQRIRWTSCDCNIADVDYMTGTVTAKAAGTTCICANALDGSGVQGVCTVTVNVNVTNISMETAKTISDESYTSGHICSPGAEQWFKFTATRTGQYTICTTGNLNTIGTLYDCCGNKIVEVDNYTTCGELNFRIIRSLTAGNIYYIKVGIYGNDIGDYTLCVTDRVFANYVTINKSSITLEKGVTYELPITPNYTYKGYNGAQRIPGLSVSINPSNANEQKIWWWEQYGDVLECSYGWDDDGDRYIHVTATGIGTSTLYAQDWNENGKRDECTVNVDAREKVTVKRDGSFNKIVFNSSGKEWLCVNYDLINNSDNLDNNTLVALRQRLYTNTYENVTYWEGMVFAENPKSYTDNEKKLLYMLDPLGFASYIQEYAKHMYKDNLSELVEFKDSVFKVLFNRDPKYYSRENNGEWYDATHEKNELDIHEELSESEALFGTHPVYDLTFALQCVDVLLHVLALPVSFAGLAGISVPLAYTEFLKYSNLCFTLTKSAIEEDYKTYIDTLVDELNGESDSNKITKSENFNMDWAQALFELSDSFGELADIVSDKPSFYKEIFEECTSNPNYQIFFEYNNGTIEAVYSISNKLN